MSRNILLRGVVAAALAALLDLLVFVVARAADVSFQLGIEGIAPEGLSWYQITGVAALGAAAGTVLAAVLRRQLPDSARRIFGPTVVGLAVLSCVPLIALGLAAGTALVLASMHLIVGAVVLVVVLPVLSDGPPARPVQAAA